MSYDLADDWDDDGYSPDDLDDHGEHGGLDAFEPDYDEDDDPYPEPRCPAAGCYDTGTDWRGRNCRVCNPTPWQARRDDWTWNVSLSWRWVRRKVRAALRRPAHSSDEPPF